MKGPRYSGASVLFAVLAGYLALKGLWSGAAIAAFGIVAAAWEFRTIRRQHQITELELQIAQSKKWVEYFKANPVDDGLANWTAQVKDLEAKLHSLKPRL